MPVRRNAIVAGTVSVLTTVVVAAAWIARPTSPGPAVATEASPTAEPSVPAPSSGPPTPGRLEVPDAGEGTFRVAAGTSSSGGDGRLLTYRVEVEDGLDEPVERFAAAVDATLGDPRGWTDEGWAFERTTDATTRVVLATPDTTDRLCLPLRTGGEVSCRNGDDVVINARRWAQGAESYGDDLFRYRQYLVNHEVGHRLGFGHVECPGDGEPSPVMAQQTLGLDGCTIDPWP